MLQKSIVSEPWEAFLNSGVGGLSKTFGHHSCPTTKNFQILLTKTPWNSSQKNEIWSRTEIIQNVRFGLYLLISDFLEESLKANKASKKCHSFYKTVTLKKHHSIYEYQLTKHHKKYTPAKQPKTLLTLKNFQKTCFWLVSKKVSLHHF